MNLTRFFESIEDLGDVGDYDNPDSIIAQSILEDYNERTGEHFDFSKFKLKEDEDGRERVRDCEDIEENNNE